MNLEERLKLFEGFKYDPVTGEIHSRLGRKVICKDRFGYIICSRTINKKLIRVKSHQLAWYLTYNEVPSIIDHIDRNKSNNKIDNLRLATNQENQWNRNNTKGYSYCKDRNKWKAAIRLNYKLIFLGYFNTESEASDTYLNAKQKYHLIGNETAYITNT